MAYTNQYFHDKYIAYKIGLCLCPPINNDHCNVTLRYHKII